jgi:4-hydroxy-tetrahydrodipicolinate synthase
MSKNKETLFEGAATAIITPFYKGKIDYKALGGLIDFQIDGGIETIVAAGTTGEAPSLSYTELEELFLFTVKRAGKRARVIAGCGCNNTERSVEVSKIAQDCGCAGILAVTPYYNRPTNAGLVTHYLSIAESVTLPIILYNVPSRTGTNMGIDVLAALAKHPRIVGVKEASGNVSVAGDIICQLGEELDVYSGNDDIAVPIMALGGKGCISVLSNLMPFETGRMCRLCLEGRISEAGRLQIELLPIIRALFCETNPIPVKYAMHRLGFCTDEYRLPLCPPSDEVKKRIDVLLEL